jgi:hypothetical protein
VYGRGSIARRQLAAIESPAEVRTGDGDPAARVKVVVVRQAEENMPH